MVSTRLWGPTKVWLDAGRVFKLRQDVEYETFFIPGCKMKIGRRDEDMLYSEGKIGDRMGVVRMVTQLKLIVIRPQGH